MSIICKNLLGKWWLLSQAILGWSRKNFALSTQPQLPYQVRASQGSKHFRLRVLENKSLAIAIYGCIGARKYNFVLRTVFPSFAKFELAVLFFPLKFEYVTISPPSFCFSLKWAFLKKSINAVTLSSTDPRLNPPYLIFWTILDLKIIDGDEFERWAFQRGF